MNDNRRKNLKRALSMLESANQIISQAADQEQDSLTIFRRACRVASDTRRWKMRYRYWSLQ